MKTNIKKTMNYALLALAGITLIFLLITALSFKNTAHAAETLSYQRNLKQNTGIHLPWSNPHNEINHKFTNSGNVVGIYTIQSYFNINDNYGGYYSGDRMMTSVSLKRGNNEKTYSDTQYIAINGLAVSETRSISAISLTSITSVAETDHTVYRDNSGSQIRELFTATVSYVK